MILSIPNSFISGGVIKASEHNANNTTISTWANGNITETNFGTLAGKVLWNVSSNVSAIDITTAANVSAIKIRTTAAVTGSLVDISSTIADTSSDAMLGVSLVHTNATIPSILASHAGKGHAIKAVQTNASNDQPLIKGTGAGTGDLIALTGTGGSFQIDANGRPTSDASYLNHNFIINGAFDFWQRNTSNAVPNHASNAPFTADRWYLKNNIGTSGVVTVASNTSTIATRVCNVKVTTAPTAAQANVVELWYTLANEDSVPLYNQNISLIFQARALGNINSIGVQFFYRTSEGKLNSSDSTIAAEATKALSGGWSTIKVENIAVGTGMTMAGVVGLRIRLLGVASGNVYDLNNGMEIGLVSLNIGNKANGFIRHGRSMAGELVACQRYFEKSYELNVVPGTAAVPGYLMVTTIGEGAGNHVICVVFKTTKIKAPVGVSYSPDSGTANKIYSYLGTSTGDQSASVDLLSQSAFRIVAGTYNSGQTCRAIAHWTADAELT